MVLLLNLKTVMMEMFYQEMDVAISAKFKELGFALAGHQFAPMFVEMGS